MQPQFDIRDYTDRSIVVRTVPENYLQNYSGHLTNLSGKWTRNLDNPVKDPTGQAGKLGGWIFPKKNEPQVRQLLQMIAAGQVPQAPPSYQRPTLAPTTAPSFMPSASLLTAAAATATPTRKDLPVATAPLFNPLSPIVGLPGLAQPGYQQIMCTVLRPTTGGTLQLQVGGQKIPLTVDSTSSRDGIVDQAIVSLPDGQRTTIRLNTGGVPRWEVAGFAQEHSITL